MALSFVACPLAINGAKIPSLSSKGISSRTVCPLNQNFLGAKIAPSSFAPAFSLSSSHARRKDISVTYFVSNNAENDSQHASNTSRRDLLKVLAYAASCSLVAVPQPAQAGRREKPKLGPIVELPSGLKYAEYKVGGGKSPEPYDRVVVHYTGKLENGYTFDSSRDSDTPGAGTKPFGFQIGVGRVIKGWDEGVMSMRVGGRRRLFIPPELAYGAKGRPSLRIPPDATLIFDIELISIAKAGQSGSKLGAFIEL